MEARPAMLARVCGIEPEKEFMERSLQEMVSRVLKIIWQTGCAYSVEREVKLPMARGMFDENELLLRLLFQYESGEAEHTPWS